MYLFICWTCEKYPLKIWTNALEIIFPLRFWQWDLYVCMIVFLIYYDYTGKDADLVKMIMYGTSSGRD